LDCAVCLAHFAFIGHDAAGMALQRIGKSFSLRYSVPVLESPLDNLFRPPVVALA
jgi:hypothetical protein